MRSSTQAIQLVVSWPLTFVFVFVAVATALSLVGLVTFTNQAQQDKLFWVLIVDVVGAGVAYFSGLLRYRPSSAGQSGPDTTPSTPQSREEPQLPSVGIDILIGRWRHNWEGHVGEVAVDRSFNYHYHGDLGAGKPRDADFTVQNARYSPAEQVITFDLVQSNGQLDAAQRLHVESRDRLVGYAAANTDKIRIYDRLA